MKPLFYAVTIAALSVNVFAERTLNKTELNTLLQTLTAAPKHTWLPAGIITARYLEFRAGEETAYESEEVFRFDGTRFYWDIRLLDPPADAPVPQTERPDFKSNQHRIFSFDGDAYSRYYKSAGYAIVTMDQQQAPSNSYGPFTAGVVPWGLETFTLDKLKTRSPRAVDYSEDGRQYTRLTLTDTRDTDTFDTTILLDPDRSYSVCAYTVQNNAIMIRQQYREHRQIGGVWIPFVITVERFQMEPTGPVLMSYEDWQFLTVDPAVPAGPFTPKFHEGTLVELQPYGQTNSFMYHAAEGVDINQLLEEKVLSLSTQNQRKANCAALVVNHITRRFSRQPAQIEPDTAAPNAQANDSGITLTSLNAMRQSLESTGLRCVAVKTDLESLKSMGNCSIILHYPNVNHYVVLDRIENESIWTIDLTSRKFYWKRSTRELLADWTNGVALLVCDEPIRLAGQMQVLDVAQQQQILGGALGYGCTELIHPTGTQVCSESVNGVCSGAYYHYYGRYGCREESGSGTCAGQPMLGYEYSYCVNNPSDLNLCAESSHRYSRLIRACM